MYLVHIGYLEAGDCMRVVKLDVTVVEQGLDISARVDMTVEIDVAVAETV